MPPVQEQDYNSCTLVAQNFNAVIVTFRTRQRYSQQSISHCQTLATNVQWMELTNPLEDFGNYRIYFIKKPCLNFGLYHVLITCLQSEIDSAEISRYVQKSEISKFTSICAVTAVPIFNPQRACAARVTVLGLCVCVCVCYSTSHFSRVIRATNNTNLLCGRWRSKF